MPGQTFNDLKKDFLQIIEGIQDQHELDALKMFVCQIVGKLVAFISVLLN